MHKSKFVYQFRDILQQSLLEYELLSKHTTIGVGGKARYFFIAKTSQDIIKAIQLAQRFNIMYKIIGGGSNIIFSDSGFDGLIIKNMTTGFQILDNYVVNSDPSYSGQLKPRLQQIAGIVKNDGVADYLINKNLKSFTDDNQKILVKLDSGWKINALILKLLNLDITGLEWFGGIPATIGGAVYMNAHGGNYFISDFIHSVNILDDNGKKIVLSKQDLQFDYDYSSFQIDKSIILSITLELYRGDTGIGQQIFEWAKQKILAQPQRSAGCIFQNLNKEQQKQINSPTSSIGYIIDKILHLKGKQIGGAKISDKHSAFIENMGNATAKDVKGLIQLIRDKALSELNINLELEVEIIDKLS